MEISIKNVLVLCLLFVTANFANAIDIESYWSVGDITIGGNFGSDGNHVVGSGSLINTSFFDIDSGFGVKISPFSFYSYANIAENENQYMISFFNISAFYDILKKNHNMQLAPFISINYFSLSGFSNYKAEIGLEFCLYPQNKIEFPSSLFPLKSKILSVRTGARLKNNVESFFAEISLDFGMILYNMINSKYKEIID